MKILAIFSVLFLSACLPGFDWRMKHLYVPALERVVEAFAQDVRDCREGGGELLDCVREVPEEYRAEVKVVLGIGDE